MELHKSSLVFLIVVFFGCIASSPAFAWNQLPLLTDSPHTLPAGCVRFDLGWQYLANRNFPFSPFSKHSGRDVLSLPVLGVRVGLGKRSELQLQYELLFVEEEEFNIRKVWQSGDLAFYTKIALLKERKIVPGIGMKFGAKLPNARDQFRVGTDETDLAFSALFEKQFSGKQLFANVGLLILGNPYRLAEQDDLLSYSIAY